MQLKSVLFKGQLYKIGTFNVISQYEIRVNLCITCMNKLELRNKGHSKIHYKKFIIVFF